MMLHLTLRLISVGISEVHNLILHVYIHSLNPQQAFSPLPFAGTIILAAHVLESSQRTLSVTDKPVKLHMQSSG